MYKRQDIGRADVNALEGGDVVLQCEFVADGQRECIAADQPARLEGIEDDPYKRIDRRERPQGLSLIHI